MKSQTTVLSIGLNDKDTKEQIIDTDRARAIISKIVSDCTMYNATGKYTHEDGTQVSEQCIRVELYDAPDNAIKVYCKKLKKQLNQECIAVSRYYTDVEFI